MLKFTSHEGFRQRLILATLSQKTIRIDEIRGDAESHTVTGLTDYEISFLRLLEKLTNGTSIEISHTGTTLVYRPGVLLGGQVHHDCPPSRGIGYFLEPFIALAPFSKAPMHITLTGITNNNVDTSVDTLRTALLPQLGKYGIRDGLELKITKRGAAPLGGGLVIFTCPIVKDLLPVQNIQQGSIKRIRGISYATRISPQIANRVVDAARQILCRYIPDVYIYTDIYKGEESGKSPGYALCLVAESTTGCLLSSECAFQTRNTITNNEMSVGTAEDDLKENYTFGTAEDLGVRVARMLLREIKIGGCVDTTTQWLSVLYAALSPEDVCKVRVGKLSLFTIGYLRDIKTFLGVSFNVQPDRETKTVMLTCLGSGFINVNKKTA